MSTIAAGVLDQANAFLPNEFREMAGIVTRQINAKTAFDLDLRFPPTFYMRERASRDPVNMALLERRR